MDLLETVLACDTVAPRYTSYPPANHFRPAIHGEEHLPWVEKSNVWQPQAVSFYVHIPFCPHRCLFCGCNTEIGMASTQVQDYFRALHVEMDGILPLVNGERPLSQIHFGGGTPNAVPLRYLGHILERLTGERKIQEGAEIALECDPALLTANKLSSLRNMGFNRISFGVQDFDPLVLKLVERETSKQPMEYWIEKANSLGFSGINVDLIYGLPRQTPVGFAKTLERTAKMRPHRIALFSYAHVPWVKGHQEVLEKSGLPDARCKLEMFLCARQLLGEAGYLWIGLDHFVLPGDELALAADTGELHRNFQGYCTRRTTGQVYGLGASAISQLQGAYCQNLHDTTQYTQAMLNNSGALGRFLEVSPETNLLREVIITLMCVGRLDLVELAPKLGLEPTALRDFLGDGWNRLCSLQTKGLVQVKPLSVEATEAGRLAVRYLAMQLDPLISPAAAKGKTYSRTI